MIPHAAIPSTNLARSVAFYQQLGFEAGKSWERPDWNMQGIFISHPSGLHIELIQHPDNNLIQHHPIPEVQHVAIPVQDLNMVFAELEKMNTTVIRPITPGITVAALTFVQDPDGNTIELYEPKE